MIWRPRCPLIERVEQIQLWSILRAQLLREGGITEAARSARLGRAMNPGRIVVLSGPSSSGKTTVARACRDLLGTKAAVLSIDQLFESVHSARRNDWEHFHVLSLVFFDALVAFAKRGFDVIGDTVFERGECVDSCLRATAGFATYLVELYCDLAILERREQARADRPSGLARRQYSSPVVGVDYSLQLDTGGLSVEECSVKVQALLDHR